MKFKNTSYFSAVVQEIQQNGKSFDSFMSTGDFKDFDKYFNFGNKFSASTYPPIAQTTRTATIVKPTKPWKQTYTSANKPRKQLDRNSENNSEKHEEKQHYKNKKFVQTKSDDSQRFLTENQQKQEDTRGHEDGADTVWTGEAFDDFSTFLDKSELSVSDWYPWENKDQKKNKMEPIEIKRKTKPAKKPSNPPKTLNLSSLDKAKVYQICKNTKSRDVTNLCKEYSLNNTREVMRKALKQRKPAMKEKKRLRKRKKAKRPQKKIDKKSKPRKHLFFESGLSFRRRKSERSRSLLEKLTSQMTQLIWPTRSGRRYDEKIAYQPKKPKGNSKPRRDWHYN